VRVLLSSTSGHGHIFPMVPLARAFAARGHEVLWATGRDACVLVADAGLDAAPAGLSGPALAEMTGRLRALAAAKPPEERAAFVFPRSFGLGATPPMVADLLPLARDWRPDLLVHEQGSLASPLVGAVLGVPNVTHSYGGPVPAALVAAAGKLLAPLWLEHGLRVPPYAGCFTSTYLDICPSRVRSEPLGHIGEVQQVRPVPYSGEQAGEPPSCLRDDQPPLIYLTLGTVTLNREAVLSATVESLAGLGVPILVTLGPDGDPDALGPQPSHVTVERYVSQTDVLPHCTAVISHAGSGTFLGALGHGLPQLCLPQAADQFRNSRGGVASGVALALHPDEATPEAITHAVHRILVEESFRVAARGLAEDIRVMPSPTEVVTALERLA
jgi:UDP:flavonoid glycosyltransferase YjiC (YdhE family)